MKYRYEIAFAGILILSCFLNFWNIWSLGISNDLNSGDMVHYTAAIL